MTCQKCGEREATETWAPDGLMGWVHGVSSQWCRRCVLREQLLFAEKLARTIPSLREELERAEGESA